MFGPFASVNSPKRKQPAGQFKGFPIDAEQKACSELSHILVLLTDHYLNTHTVSEE